MSFLDNLPIATITFVVGIILVLVGVITDEIAVEKGLELIGFVGLGAGGIGLARNGSGRGIRGDTNLDR